MICIYYGKPRSGKTTALARIVKRDLTKRKWCKRFPFLKKFLNPYSAIYTTDPSIKGCTYITYQNLGKWKPETHSCFILSEAGIGLNNRAWKTLSADAKELFAMHGHLRCDIYADSQTIDIDITLRQRCEKFYAVRRLGTSQWSLLVPIRFDIDVNDVTLKIEECFRRARGLKLFFSILLGKVIIIYRKCFYKQFDSYYWDKKFPLTKPC